MGGRPGGGQSDGGSSWPASSLCDRDLYDIHGRQPVRDYVLCDNARPVPYFHKVEQHAAKQQSVHREDSVR